MARFDIRIPAPPALRFGAGEDAFGLRVHLPTAADRAALMDALGTGTIEAVQRAAERLVDGWEDVLAANGQPAEFWRQEPRRDGRGEAILDVNHEPILERVKNIDLFLGRVPFAAQVETLLGLLSFAGMPAAAIDTYRAILGAVRAAEPDPTPPPPASALSDSPAS